MLMSETLKAAVLYDDDVLTLSSVTNLFGTINKCLSKSNTQLNMSEFEYSNPSTLQVSLTPGVAKCGVVMFFKCISARVDWVDVNASLKKLSQHVDYKRVVLVFVTRSSNSTFDVYPRHSDVCTVTLAIDPKRQFAFYEACTNADQVGELVQYILKFATPHNAHTELKQTNSNELVVVETSSNALVSHSWMNVLKCIFE